MPGAPDPSPHPAPLSPRRRWSTITELSRKAIHNPSAMIVANTGVQSALRLVSNVLLARLLAPSAFALMAITAMILTGITMVSDVGIAITALREGQLSRDDEDKLWTMQLIRGLGVALFMIVIATPVGWLYNDMQLRDVFFALALMPVLQGGQSLFPILALGHRRLLPSTLLEIGGRVGGMVLSVLAALVSPTVWALVVGTLAGLVVSTFGSHAMAGRLPRFVVDLGYMRRQWRFSRWIQTSSTLTFVGSQVDKALFPFLYNMTSLGIYGIASTFATMPAQITQRWSASVFYPLTVELLTKGSEPRRRLMAVRTSMLLYTAVITLAIAAVSPPFFMLFYAPRYHAAARFAAILALGVFFDTAESSLRHLPLVEYTPHYEVWVVVARMIGFGLALLAIYLTDLSAIFYAMAYVFGLACGHLFMLATCVRKGYLRPSFDLTLALPLTGTVIALWFVPVPTGSWKLIAWGITIGVLAIAALLLIYRRRGFPSLPAEPTPEALLESAEEEVNLRPDANAPQSPIA